MNNITGTSSAMQVLAQKREEERRTHNEALGEPAIFIPHDEATGHGVGWFHKNGHMVAYSKNHMGYEMYPIAMLEDVLIKRLYEVIRLSETL